MAHNDEITFDVPYNTGYIITETTDGYTLTKRNDTGTIATSPITATFTNILNKTIETGVEDNRTTTALIFLLSLSAIVITIENRKKRQRKPN